MCDDQNVKYFIREKSSEIIVFDVATILSRVWWVKCFNCRDINVQKF